MLALRLEIHTLDSGSNIFERMIPTRSPGRNIWDAAKPTAVNGESISRSKKTKPRLQVRLFRFSFPEQNLCLEHFPRSPYSLHIYIFRPLQLIVAETATCKKRQASAVSTENDKPSMW